MALIEDGKASRWAMMVGVGTPEMGSCRRELDSTPKIVWTGGTV